MKKLLLIALTFLTLACSTGSSTENVSSPFMKASYVLPVGNREVRIRIQTLNGTNLLDDNNVNIITSGSFTASRIDLTGEQRLSVRDMGSDIMELTVKIDAVNLAKIISCANNQ